MVDRRLVEGVVERGKAVRGRRPLLDDGRVTAGTRLRADWFIDHKAILVEVPGEFLRLRQIAARDDPRGQHVAGGRRRSGREKGAFGRDEIGGDKVGRRVIGNLPRLGARAGVLASGKGLLGRRRVLLAAIGHPVEHHGEREQPDHRYGHDAIGPRGRLPQREAAVRQVKEGNQNRRGHVAPIGHRVAAVARRAEDEQPADGQDDAQRQGGDAGVDGPLAAFAPNGR